MRRKRIAVLMAGVDKEYQQGFTRGMYRAAQAQDVDLCIFNCQGHADGIERNDLGEQAIFSLPELSQFDGVVALLETIPTEECSLHIRSMLEQCPGIPLVTIDCQWPGSVSISFDDQTSVGQLIQHLYQEHNARRFAMVTGPAETDVAQRRRDAAIGMIRALGGVILEDSVFDGRWVRDGGRKAAEELLRKGELPDVIVCGNDDMAFGVVECLRENGKRIPEDVAVTGFDAVNEAVGRGLTTILRPVQEAGERAVSVLMQWMREGKPADTEIEMSTQVIYGDSCGCAYDANRAVLHVRQLSAAHRDVEMMLLKGVSSFSSLSGTTELQTAGEQIERFARDWGAEQFHVCVDPEFLHHTGKESLHGYPREMLQLSGDAEEIRFKTRKLLPLLDEERDAPLALVFLPLYSGTDSIGYAVLDVMHAGGYAVYALLTLLAASLGSMALHAALEDMSTHDVLTGMYNRRGMHQVVPPVFQRAKEEKRCFAIVSCDMNGMKQINDKYGHHRGDEAIVRMSHVIAQLESDDMICVHISGDEFVAAGMVEDDEAARRLPQQLQDGLDAINAKNDWVCDIEASFGVFSGVPSDENDLAYFMRIADRRMYQDKACKKAVKKFM